MLPAAYELLRIKNSTIIFAIPFYSIRLANKIIHLHIKLSPTSYAQLPQHKKDEIILKLFHLLFQKLVAFLNHYSKGILVFFLNLTNKPT